MGGKNGQESQSNTTDGYTDETVVLFDPEDTSGWTDRDPVASPIERLRDTIKDLFAKPENDHSKQDIHQEPGVVFIFPDPNAKKYSRYNLDKKNPQNIADYLRFLLTSHPEDITKFIESHALNITYDWWPELMQGFLLLNEYEQLKFVCRLGIRNFYQFIDEIKNPKIIAEAIKKHPNEEVRMSAIVYWLEDPQSGYGPDRLIDILKELGTEEVDNIVSYQIAKYLDKKAGNASWTISFLFKAFTAGVITESLLAECLEQISEKDMLNHLIESPFHEEDRDAVARMVTIMQPSFRKEGYMRILQEQSKKEVA